MARYNVMVAGHPDWVDQAIWRDSQKPRFDYFMRYMVWIVQAVIDYAKARGFEVVDLYKDDINREKLKSTLDSVDPIFYIHGSHMACVPPNTLVCVNDDLKAISQLNIGDKVLTHKGEYKPITKIFRRYYKGNLVKIKPYYSPPILLTPEHPVLAIQTQKCSCKKVICSKLCREKIKEKGTVKRKYWSRERGKFRIRTEVCRKYYENYELKWVEAKDLKPGDFVAWAFPNKEVDIKSIKVSDYVDVLVEDGLAYWKTSLPYNEGKKHNTSNPIPNEIEITPDFMRLVGYYLAEGHIDNNVLNFSFNKKEVEYINDVKKIMSDLFNLKPSERVVKNVHRLSFGCKPLAIIFGKLFGRKSGEKQLPQFFLFLPTYKQKELIKGLFRGDGSLVSGKVLDYCTSSPKLLQQVRIILARLGVVASFEEAKELVCTIEGRKVKFGKVCHTRLRDKKLFKEVFNVEVEGEPKARLGYIDGNYFISRIRQVEETPYDGYVYNLEVEGDNSFSLIGATVHNCNAAAGAPYRPPEPYETICSPRRGICCSADIPCIPIIGDISRPCGCEIGKCPNHDWFAGRVVYLIGCAAGRWLAEDMVNAGALAAIGYSDLLWFAIGLDGPSSWWIEEVFRDCYISGALRLIDGGTAFEAAETIKRTYEYYAYDWLPKNHPDMAGKLAPILVKNMNRVVLHGDPNARIRQEVIPPIRPPRKVPWEGILIGSTIFGIAAGFTLGGK